MPWPKRSIKEFGAPDMLVNCAGYVHQGSVLDCSEKDWDFSFDLNVKSMHRTIKAFLPAMLKNGGGSIINISSARVLDPRRAQPLCLRRHQGGGHRPDQSGRRRFHPPGHPLQRHLPRHDRVAVVRGTRAGGRQANGQVRSKQVRKNFIARQPMARLGTAEEVAALAVFLASDESSYITGQPHLVDGGMAL